MTGIRRTTASSLLPGPVQRSLGSAIELLPGSPTLKRIEAGRTELLDNLPEGLVVDNFVSDVTPGWLPGGHDLLVPMSSARIPEHDNVIEHLMQRGDGRGAIGHLSSHANGWFRGVTDDVMAYRQAVAEGR